MKTSRIFVCASLSLLLQLAVTYAIDIKDWPMYRRDESRTATTPMTLPGTLNLQWVRELPVLTPAWVPGTSRSDSEFDRGYEPIVLGKMMYVSSNKSDSVTAYNTDTGALVWRFFAGGPVRFAPVAWKDGATSRLYLVSDDGYLYSLNALTGQELWKVRGGPYDRMFFANSRLSSIWPARGGPVLYNDKIYFGAGLMPMEGIFVYAIDARTGIAAWENDQAGQLMSAQPHGGTVITGMIPQGHIVVNSTKTKIYLPTGHAQHGSFDLTGKMDVYAQEYSATTNRSNASVFVDQYGIPQGRFGFPVKIVTGSGTYTTGPGIADPVHTLLAADDKLFVVTKGATTHKIYCFGGTVVSNPPTHKESFGNLTTTADEWASMAAKILAQESKVEGSCTVWGIGTGRLVEELARQAKLGSLKLHIDAFDSDVSKCNTLRAKLLAAGLYGSIDANVRVAVHALDPKNVEFPPYAARVICSEDVTMAGFNDGVSFVQKLFQATRPYGGTAWLPLTAAQHSSFLTWIGSANLQQAVSARDGTLSLLTRSGALVGSADFVAGSVLKADKVAKPPYGLSWIGNEGMFGMDSGAIVTAENDVANGKMVTSLGTARDVYTGLPLTSPATYSGSKILESQAVGQRQNPFTGLLETRDFKKYWGCGDGVKLGDHIVYRSATAGYYHVPTESGTVHLGGMRPGCRSTGIIPANGMLLMGQAKVHHCQCNFPIHGVAGFVNRSSGFQSGAWLPDRTSKTIEEDPIRKVGFSFGNLGIRMEKGVMWTSRPVEVLPPPEIPMTIEPNATVTAYRHPTTWIKNENPMAWVQSSGIKGVQSLKLNLGYPSLVSLPSATPPAIDATLTDSCWDGKSEVALSVFQVSEGTSGKQLNPATAGFVQFRYDANKLYVAMKFLGNLTVINDSGTVNRWDLFLTDRTQVAGKYVHFGIDTLGAVYEGKWTTGLTTEDAAWVGTWTQAYKLSTTEFIVEMAIPWSTLQAEGLDKTKLLANVQGPTVLGLGKNPDYLRVRNATGNGVAWKPGVNWNICKLFCPLTQDVGYGDLGKTRSYTVRMHFAEPEESLTRSFDVSIQGTKVLSNFNIASAAGGTRRGIVKEFTNIAVRDFLNINFTPIIGEPVISGLEVVESGAVTPDTIAPSVPTGLIASASSSSQVNLSWTASTDNVGVVGYKVYRNGTLVGSPSGTSYSDTGLTASTTYNYKVAAFDAAGNTSAQSTQSSTTTLSGGDITPPTVAVTAPASGATVSGSTVTLSANATDNIAVVAVQFKVDGANVGAEDASSPYSIAWNSTTVANGSHTVTAVARDAAGNNTTSSSVNVTVNNIVSDTTPPTVAITAPASGATVSGNITVSATASDNVAVVGVQFKVDGFNLGAEDTTSPYSLVTDTTILSNGSHSFTAVARDAAGNTKTATAVTVTVSNILTPAAPSGLVATFASPTQVSLTWNDNSTNETGFRIERKVGTGGTYALLASVGAEIESYTDSTIVVGIQYFYRVCATSSLGSSAFSNEASPSTSTVIVGAIAGGRKHSIAVKDDGTVWTWGANDSKQLGTGSTIASTNIPIRVTTLTGMIAVAAGSDHNLALKSDGTVWGWGFNSTGQLGNSSTSTPATPVKATGLSGVQEITAGYNHSAAITADGSVWTWGGNSYGQLGNGALVTKTAPIKVSGLLATSVAAGTYYTLIAAQDGTVWGWGYNTSGQLGNNTLINSSVPVKANGLSNVTRVAAGASHALALKSDGTVWAWGLNSSGQLGRGTTNSSPVAVQVSGLSGVVEIACGGAHSLAIKSDGTIWTWGSNGKGQLARGGNSLVPAQVSGATSVVGMAGASSHTMVLFADGTLKASGDNGSGKLGIGVLGDESVLTVIPGLDLISP
jgi:alpha-tubulin suppressor-like RCC1 family protein/chitodextrinase